MTTRLAYGWGGWVRVDEPEALPGPLYARFEDVEGVLRVVDLYLDGRGKPIDAQVIKKLPVHRLEVLAIAGEGEGVLRSRLKTIGVDLSTLASHFGQIAPQVLNLPEGVPYPALDWVQLSLASKVPKSGVAKVKRHDAHDVPAAVYDKPVTLKPPANGLTDHFLSQVASAYMSALARHLPPAVTIAEESGGTVSARNVHKWVAKARARGIMDRDPKRGRPA